MKNNGRFLITSGVLMIVSAFVLTGYNMAENRQAEQSVIRVMEQLRSGEMSPQTESLAEARQKTPYITGVSVVTDITEQEIPDYLLNPEMEMPETIIDDYAYIGVLEIPACSLELPVISEWSYPALKVAPCRYEGSIYTDDMIIAAHDYKAHFKAVRDLKGGEKVLFTDTDGNTFTYEVTGKETISGSDLAGLKDGEWDLVLFTCTFDGRSRVVVECSRVE